MFEHQCGVGPRAGLQAHGIRAADAAVSARAKVTQMQSPPIFQAAKGPLVFRQQTPGVYSRSELVPPVACRCAAAAAAVAAAITAAIAAAIAAAITAAVAAVAL